MSTKLEVGKPFGFEELKSKLSPGDINVHVKAGIVVQGKMGSLVALRDALEEHMKGAGGDLVYFTITAQPVYLVHWNDLSLEKQKSIERKKQ